MFRVVIIALLFVTLGGCASTSKYTEEALNQKRTQAVLDLVRQFRANFRELQDVIAPMHGDVELACAKFGEQSGLCKEMTRLWDLQEGQAAIVDKLLAQVKKTGRGLLDLQGALQVYRDIIQDIFKESGRVRAAVRLADGRPNPAPAVHGNETVVVGAL